MITTDKKLSWPMNLMHAIFGCKGHICIDEDANLDLNNISEVEDRLLKALNELTIWEKDMLIRVYMNNESITSICDYYNASADRVNSEMKSAISRIRRNKTKSHDILIHNDKNYSERITSVIRENKVIGRVNLNTLIRDLPLSTRSYNILCKRNIVTVGDLVKYSEKDLSGFANMGKVSLSEITCLMKRCGYNFADDKQ